jgi:hypothetical protein
MSTHHNEVLLSPNAIPFVPVKTRLTLHIHREGQSVVFILSDNEDEVDGARIEMPVEKLRALLNA